MNKRPGSISGIPGLTPATSGSGLQQALELRLIKFAAGAGCTKTLVTAGAPSNAMAQSMKIFDLRVQPNQCSLRFRIPRSAWIIWGSLSSERQHYGTIQRQERCDWHIDR